jgi:hypothetical protein
MNAKEHRGTDPAGRPLRMFLTAAQQSDDIGARPAGRPAFHKTLGRKTTAQAFAEEIKNAAQNAAIET